MTAQEWDTHVAGYDRIATLQDRYGHHAAGAEVLQVRQLRAEAAAERDRAAVHERQTEVGRSFQKDTPELAMTKHPPLAGAYAVMHTIDTQAKEHGMDAAQRQIVMARTREQIGCSIGGGSSPEMRVTETSPGPGRSQAAAAGTRKMSLSLNSRLE